MEKIGMYLFTKRKKVPRLVSMAAIIVAASLVIGFSAKMAVHGASQGQQTVVYHATPGTVALLSTTRPGLKPALAQSGKHVVPLRSAASGASLSFKESLPGVDNTVLQTKPGNLLQNFQGIDDRDQRATNGDVLTPPDQGLCVGTDPGVPGKLVVFEPVNSLIRESGIDGNALPGTPLLGNRDVSFRNFWEPEAFGDPRCFYDPAMKSFYFTVIGMLQSGPAKGQTSIDVAVYNAHGFAVYQIDSSLGGLFFGDQPHVGYDNNNLYLSTDAFNVNGTAYFGATLFVISKSQLVAEATSLNEAIFGPVSLGGLPIVTLQPAVSTSSTKTEYLMNSFPFADAAFTPNSVSKQLGLWNVQNGEELSKGNAQKLTLSGKIIPSESYVFPVNAVSTGTGQTTGGVTSQAFLTPDDSRLQQVQYIDGHLWSSLTAAVSVGKDPVARDGVAWFEIDANSGRVSSQGYIASQGNYLIYPAILHNEEGLTVITFTITSATLNPSAASTVRNSGSQNFGNIEIAAPGSSAHLSFAQRWGDYSAATFAPNGQDIWLATEYVPDAAHQDPEDNWGTRVFEVKGS